MLLSIGNIQIYGANQAGYQGFRKTKDFKSVGSAPNAWLPNVLKKFQMCR